MGDHHSEIGVLGQPNRLEGFRERPNLVQLDENRVGRLFVDSPLENPGIGHEKVVADDLQALPQFRGQTTPTRPIALG